MRSGLVLALLVVSRLALASEAGCPGEVSASGAQATWYDLVGEGACSLPVAPGELIAAIATPSYAGSSMCGRCVRVDGPTASVTVRIVDECATCSGADLDLGQNAFAALDDPIVGVLPISWTTVACDVGSATMKMQFEGSNSFYLKVQVQDHRHGIASVEMLDGATRVAMQRTSDDHWVRESFSDPFVEPFTFWITDVHGQQVETAPIALVNDVPLDTGVQLAPCPEAAGALGPVAAICALAFWWKTKREAPSEASSPFPA